MKKRRTELDQVNTGGWLTTYADLMNNLLVLFIALYAMSMIDLDKYQQFIGSFQENFDGKPVTAIYVDSTLDPEQTQTPPETTATSPGQVRPGPDDFDELYERVKTILGERGYQNQLQVEKVDAYIYFRFTEGVFFYPDSPVMKENSYPIMQTVGEILRDSVDLIEVIEISGHTAKITKGPPSKTNFFAWELSSNRALTVLKFLVQKCDVPQTIMSITGYASNRPYATGFAEEYWAQNRRVEIRISKKTDFDTPPLEP